MAQIDRVGYSRLYSFGHYENETVHAEATVGGDETPESVLQDLQAWVTSRLARHEAIEAERSGAEHWRYQAQTYEQQAKRWQAQAEKIKAFLERHGVTVDKWGELPF